MVDELLTATPTGAETRWTVPPDNMLLVENELPAAGLMENVAQSAAAWIGKQARDNNAPVRIGFIGAVKKMVIHRLPKVGETLQTTITVIESVFDITLIHALVTLEQGTRMSSPAIEKPLAELDLKIALQ